GDRAVRPGKVDIFKNAERAPFMFRKRADAAHAILVDDHDLAWLDIAEKFGMNQIEGAGLARQHPGVAHLADRERAKPVRIADTDQLLLGHDDERISAFDPMHRLNQIVFTSAE